MTLVIDSVDYSAYIQQKTDIVETPRYINGENVGTAINGTAIRDRVAVKYDLQVRLRPLDDTQMRTLLSAIEGNSVSIRYTSFLSATARTITAQASASSVSYCTTANGSRIYGDVVLSFEEN